MLPLPSLILVVMWRVIRVPMMIMVMVMTLCLVVMWRIARVPMMEKSVAIAQARRRSREVGDAPRALAVVMAIV